jgi:uncharacterized membrane protein YdjX (TVP38/TMEM64 family)
VGRLKLPGIGGSAHLDHIRAELRRCPAKALLLTVHWPGAPVDLTSPARCFEGSLGE